jgi:uncharacterized membrane protein
MAENLRTPLLLAALVAAGLQAGTYYVWTCGVMPGLARTDDRTFVNTMNHVNQAILNPAFLATFVGTPLLAAAALTVSTAQTRPWTIAALVAAIATVVVTGAGNVPLNEALRAATTAPEADLAAARAAFESAWVRCNGIRTLTATAALAALGWAALRS